MNGIQSVCHSRKHNNTFQKGLPTPPGHPNGPRNVKLPLVDPRRAKFFLLACGGLLHKVSGDNIQRSISLQDFASLGMTEIDFASLTFQDTPSPAPPRGTRRVLLQLHRENLLMCKKGWNGGTPDEFTSFTNILR